MRYIDFILKTQHDQVREFFHKDFRFWHASQVGQNLHDNWRECDEIVVEYVNPLNRCAD